MALLERIKEKLMGYITPRGFDELIGAELKEVAQLEANKREMLNTIEDLEADLLHYKDLYNAEKNKTAKLKALGGES